MSNIQLAVAIALVRKLAVVSRSIDMDRVLMNRAKNKSKFREAWVEFHLDRSERIYELMGLAALGDKL